MSWTERWGPADRAVADATAGRPCGTVDDRFVACAIREKTAGIIARRVDDPRLRAISSAVLARNVVALSQAREVLASIGAEVIPLKGLHLLGSRYAPGERDLGDLDLLVPRHRVADADASLRRLGFRPEVPAERVLEAGGGYLNSALYEAPDRLPVHLHWHVVNASLPLFMVRIRVEEIWAESVAAGDSRRMAPHHLLVTLAEHALKHSYDSLIHLADLDRVWRAGVDARLARSTAARWGVEPALRLGLHFAREILGTPADAGVPSGALERWVVRSVRENRRWSGLGAVGYLSMASGWRAKARFVRAALSPPARDVETFRKSPGWRTVAHRAWAAVSLLSRLT